MTSQELMPKAGPFRVAAAKLWLKFFGWKAVGTVPSLTHCIFIAAPHTSNWDLPHTIAVCWALDMRISWVGKSSLFKFPFVTFLKWMGGVPVIRDQKLSQVQRIAETLKREKKMFLVISPPGTRTKMDHWKSGFYHISREANVPVLCGFLDWSKKEGGIGPLVTPTGDVKLDMDKIREFYGPINGRFPAQMSDMKLKEENGQVEVAKAS